MKHCLTVILKATLEESSEVYFAGHVAKKLYDIHCCDLCEAKYVKSNEHLADIDEMLIIHKMYDRSNISTGGLRAPSDLLKIIVRLCLDVFNKKFKKMYFKKR